MAHRPSACRRLYLVRHGETLYESERHLTEAGYRQIEALGEILANVALDAIYASPLGRAQATAETIARRTPAPIITMEALREIESGELAGKDLGEVLSGIRAFFANGDTSWDTPFLGGETYRQVRERVWPLIDDHARRNDWSQVAVVAHGGVNNAIIGRVLGASGPGLINVEQDFGCVNIIDFFQDRPVVRLLNFTAYDPLKRDLDGSSFDVLQSLIEGTPQFFLDKPR